MIVNECDWDSAYTCICICLYHPRLDRKGTLHFIYLYSWTISRVVSSKKAVSKIKTETKLHWVILINICMVAARYAVAAVKKTNKQTKTHFSWGQKKGHEMLTSYICVHAYHLRIACSTQGCFVLHASTCSFMLWEYSKVPLCADRQCCSTLM